MSNSRTAIILGLAALAGGCTVAPRHQEVRVYQHERVVHDRHVVHENDAYEGYYYVRIVYLNGVPWYVDDDLHARQVPPHLRSQFRHASWVRSAPPRFSRDPRVRDGYALSRIVYINGAPYHVDEDRRARPIPKKLRGRFAYESVAFADEAGRRPVYREREAPAGSGGGDAFGRAAERVREPGRPMPAASERDRQAPPAYGSGDARGRVMEQARGREDVRPLPPADDRPRHEPSSSGGAFAQAAERVREQSARQAPPPAQSGESRSAARDDSHMEAGPSARDGQRMTPPVAHQPDGGRPEQAQPQAAGNDRGRGNAVANERERGRADQAPGRKNGKGRGPAQDQEADSADERDDPPGRGRRRDE